MAKRNHLAVRIAAIMLICSTAALAGCSATSSLSHEMAAMQGSPAGVARAAWGAPTATEALDEGTLLIWMDYAGTYGGAPVPVVICERQLAVDATGSISGWRWRGDACESLHRNRTATASMQAQRR